MVRNELRATAREKFGPEPAFVYFVVLPIVYDRLSMQDSRLRMGTSSAGKLVNSNPDNLIYTSCKVLGNFDLKIRPHGP